MTFTFTFGYFERIDLDHSSRSLLAPTPVFTGVTAFGFIGVGLETDKDTTIIKSENWKCSGTDKTNKNTENYYEGHWTMVKS